MDGTERKRLHETPRGGEAVSRLELETRVLYSLLQPVVRFAHRSRMPLDRATELLTLAYLQELRRGGMTLKEAAEVLGKSLRTVSAISARLRDDFLAPEQAHGLPRKVEFHLTTGPRTLAELMEAMGPGATGGSVGASREEVEGALAELLAEGRIERVERDDGREAWVASQRYANLVQTSNVERRIDALNHLGDTVLDTVIARFFEEDEAAFARTVTFAASREDVGGLRQRLYDTLRLGASDLEDAAAERGDMDERFAVVLCVTPVGRDRE